MIIFCDTGTTIAKGKRQDATYQEVTRKLRGFLNRKEPELIRMFTRFWSGQRNAITYREIEDLIESEMKVTGSAYASLNSDYMDRWRQEYAEFITEKLAPAWREAMNISARNITDHRQGFIFDATAENVRLWTGENSAKLVADLTESQVNALGALVQRAATIQDIGAYQLSTVIRATIGLYPGQAAANLKYYQHVRDTLIKGNPTMKVDTANAMSRELAEKYAGRQHRYRAMSIARNELANAYLEGEQLAVEQAQSAGLLGQCNRRWVTARDERTCEICGVMNGVTVKDGEAFRLPNGKVTRTAHAHNCCRCGVVYEEIDPFAGLK